MSQQILTTQQAHGAAVGTPADRFNASAAPSIQIGALSWSPGLLAVPLIVLTFAARLFRLDLMEFRLDSAYWSIEAQNLLRGEGLPLIGQQVGSVQVPLYNGPLFTYLVAAVSLPSGGSPIGVALVIGLANAVGALLLARFARDRYGMSVGLTTLAILACSPWLVLFSRMLWPQSLFPLLIPVSFIVLYWAVELGCSRRLALWGISIGAAAQLHLSALALVPIGFIYVLISLRPRRILPWMAMLVGLGAGYMPVPLYELTHGFTNLRGLLGLGANRMAQDEEGMQRLLKYAWNLSNVVSGQGLWESKLGWRENVLPAWVEWGQGAIWGGLFVLSLAALALAIIRSVKPGMRVESRSARSDLLCLLYLGLPLAYLLISNGPILRHHFLLIVPIAVFAIARGLQLLPRKLQPWLATTATAGVLLNIITTFNAFEYLAVNRGGWDYGTVLADKLQAVDWLVERSGSEFVVDASRTREPLAYYQLIRTRTSADFDETRGVIRSSPTTASAVSCVIVEPWYYERPERTSANVAFVGAIEIAAVNPNCRAAS